MWNISGLAVEKDSQHGVLEFDLVVGRGLSVRALSNKTKEVYNNVESLQNCLFYRFVYQCTQL